eukprot:TRINITY_DN1994_c0_g1_i1.p1 TRINITY_DN1994_c0_g1~~TRINITY_DN1994_c0_g1_i1.p1  ORF type:complete len:630 (-),score=85.29 TRINITY_DN1994_c0_g1_i1:94-1983(-)
MGGICSRGMGERNSISVSADAGESTKITNVKSSNEIIKEPISLSDPNILPVYWRTSRKFDSGELRLPDSGKFKVPAKTGTSKAPEVSSLLGRAGIAGIERAVEVLDTLGSSMSNLNPGSGFVSGMTFRGNKISILAFEVANTIVKGSNLMQSLSKENIQFLKKEILPSDGVKRLVSTDMLELLSIASADKREEFDVFSREVVRFGHLCKDPQWHNLDRYFQKLDSDVTSQKQPKEEAEEMMHQLTELAQQTSELYHELHALDRFEQDYRRKVQEEASLHVTRRGESLMILHSELKRQRKLVRSLKKKSLWSKNLEEVVEKLVDIVTFLHQEIKEAFVTNVLPDTKLFDKVPVHTPQRLGVSGLALHYANIINQIDNIVCRPSSLPPNTRDTLYHGLPTGVKASLRSRLQSFHAVEELTVPQIKAEMEKTLQWIVPIAMNTVKAHQGFGWVGEWANTGAELNSKTALQNNLIRIQTLYHAEKEKADEYILELVIWLHHLVSQAKQRDQGFKPVESIRSPTRKGSFLLAETEKFPSPRHNSKTSKVSQISEEDREMLEAVKFRKLVPGLSKSQELVRTHKKFIKHWGLSRSLGNSPTKELSADLSLDCERAKAMDVLDGLDTFDNFTVTDT